MAVNDVVAAVRIVADQPSLELWWRPFVRLWIGERLRAGATPEEVASELSEMDCPIPSFEWSAEMVLKVKEGMVGG